MEYFVRKYCRCYKLLVLFLTLKTVNWKQQLQQYYHNITIMRVFSTILHLIQMSIHMIFKSQFLNWIFIYLEDWFFFVFFLSEENSTLFLNHWLMFLLTFSYLSDWKIWTLMLFLPVSSSSFANINFNYAFVLIHLSVKFQICFSFKSAFSFCGSCLSFAPNYTLTF